MKIYVVGLGPGEKAQMTHKALEVLEDSDVIAGYTVYVDLIRDMFSHKEFLTTPMRQEVVRCEMARDEALKGRTVSMVCSGDSGVYGMAGLIYEVCENYPEIEIEVVAGVTAALSGAAVLGAPLIHDFCLISLSDLLTPMELIEKRVKAASEADFAVCFYNPSSKKRVDHVQRACDIMLQFKSPDTPCGIVKNIGREGENYKIVTLKELRDDSTIDMFTTVFVGNSGTKIMNNKMVTPRGYKLSQV